MSGEPPEGDPPTHGRSSAAALASDSLDMDGVAPTQRLPPVAADDAPPEIHKFLSPPPPPARHSEVPPSGGSGGNSRRRSRRTVSTVKIPTQRVSEVPESGSAWDIPDSVPPPAVAPVAPVASVARSRELPESATALERRSRPLQVIPPTPPVPAHRTAPTLPAIPRPSAKPPAQPPAAPAPPVEAKAPAPAAAPESPPSPAEETYEVIRPMRIINIDASPPSTPAPPAPPASTTPSASPAAPPAAPPAPLASASPEPAAPVDHALDGDGAKRASRPPMLASAALDDFVAPPPSALPKPPKPPVVEEVEAIEEMEDHAVASAPPESLSAEPEVPRGARTDEIEPIPLDDDDDRISDFDVAATGEMLAVEIPVDLEAPKPKKPPPPPPKRTMSGEMAAVSSASPLSGSPSSLPPVSSARLLGVDATPPAPPITPVTPPLASPPPPPPAAAATGGGPSTSPASVQTVDLSGRKRQKPWWEEIFSDDYIRTLEKVEPKAIRKECDFIEDRLGLEKGAVMLDLACGAGSHAVELAARGYNVVGYDLSLAMLARAQDEAQDRGQKINFLQGDMREMAFEEAFDGMYSWSTSFGYFDDETNVNVLSRIHRGLRQGGMFLLDVINRDYVCPRQPSLVWFEGDGCVCMDEMHVDFFTSRLRVKRTVMFEDGRSRECDYGIRLYGLHEIGKMLHDTGFKVVEVTGHPAHPGVFFGSESPRIIVLAERG